MKQSPPWPWWAIPAVLLGAIASLLVAGGVAVLVAALTGADDVTPATVLVASALTLAGIWVVLRGVARRADVGFDPGLHRLPPRMTLVLLAFGTAVALVAAGATALVADVDFDHPEELGGEQTVVQLDLATVASVLARAVIAAIALELLLRAFLLPALAQRVGTPIAVAGIAIVTALAGETELAAAMAVIGVALCVMYLESGSILPGIALNAGVQAFVLGVGFDWSPPECAALAVPAAAVAFAIGWSWDRDPRTS